MDELRTTRQTWDTALSQISASLLVQPDTIGNWAMKDVMVHCTLYAAWFVRTMQAHLRGEPPLIDGTEYISADDRNAMHYQQSQRMSLAEALEDFSSNFEQLINVVDAHPADFFSKLQQFVGIAEDVDVGGQIHHLSEHYQAHLREILEYTARSS